MGVKLNHKRAMLNDQKGIAPLIAGIIVLVVASAIGISALAVWNITQRPDITYNITDTGFSLAGVDASSIYVIAGIIGVLAFLYFWFKKPSTPQNK